jgi:RNA polymerase sigma factor (sigma-70 family)
MEQIPFFGRDCSMSRPKSSRNSGKPYVMAVVLGTALAALNSTESLSAHEGNPEQAISNISRYCTACWRNARLPIDRWGDCTQEVFERLLQRVPRSGWEQVLSGETEERREFLRAIDTVKKRHQRDRARATSLSDAAAEVPDERIPLVNEEREAIFDASQQLLSGRQQRILKMICEGHGVADIAIRLAMTPERVSDEKYKAIQKLRGHFETKAEVAVGA